MLYILDKQKRCVSFLCHCSMGGLLKSEDEELAYKQAEDAKAGVKLFRVTAMFSATMPAEVCFV